jgi:hypothetical protein
MKINKETVTGLTGGMAAGSIGLANKDTILFRKFY